MGLMVEANGLLAVWMTPAPENEDDLNAWYSEEHLRERLAVPGFIAARRYVSLDGEPKYVALYDLADADVLASDEYRRVLGNGTPWTRRIIDNLQAMVRNEYELVHARGVARATPAPYAFLVRIECDREHDAEFRDWYGRDHLPAACTVPGVCTAKLYRARAGEPRYLAVYELDAPDIPGGPAWRAGTQSEWTERMRPLFKNRSNNLGQLIASVSN
jgi:hypothetical protein